MRLGNSKPCEKRALSVLHSFSGASHFWLHKQYAPTRSLLIAFAAKIIKLVFRCFVRLFVHQSLVGWLQSQQRFLFSACAVINSSALSHVNVQLIKSAGFFGSHRVISSAFLSWMHRQSQNNISFREFSYAFHLYVPSPVSCSLFLLSERRAPVYGWVKLFCPSPDDEYRSGTLLIWILKSRAGGW